MIKEVDTQELRAELVDRLKMTRYGHEFVDLVIWVIEEGTYEGSKCSFPNCKCPGGKVCAP